MQTSYPAEGNWEAREATTLDRPKNPESTPVTNKSSRGRSIRFFVVAWRGAKRLLLCTCGWRYWNPQCSTPLLGTWTPASPDSWKQITVQGTAMRDFRTATGQWRGQVEAKIMRLRCVAVSSSILSHFRPVAIGRVLSPITADSVAPIAAFASPVFLVTVVTHQSSSAPAHRRCVRHHPL